MSSVGSWKQSDLPLAVPVVTIVGPAQAACSASAWCDQSRSTPRASSASATSGCSSSGSATARARAAVLRGLHDQPLVLAAGGEQRVPGLDVADDGHPSLSLDGAYGRRPNQTSESAPPASRSTNAPPANATVTSRCSGLEVSRVPIRL